MRLTLTSECSIWTCSFLPHSFSLNLDLLAAIMPIAISFMGKTLKQICFLSQMFLLNKISEEHLKAEKQGAEAFGPKGINS